MLYVLLSFNKLLQIIVYIDIMFDRLEFYGNKFIDCKYVRLYFCSRPNMVPLQRSFAACRQCHCKKAKRLRIRFGDDSAAQQDIVSQLVI